MKLHRVAMIRIDGDAKPGLPHARLGDVEVECHRTTLKGQPSDQILVTASIQLYDLPVVDHESYVVIPDEPRRQCEAAIMLCADMLAVFGRSRRRVTSAVPSLALSDLSAEQRLAFELSKGFRPQFRSTASAAVPIDLGDAQLVESLSDRLFGVSVLAEVHSTDSALARYRELVRFYEHAFAKQLSQSVKKMAQFLGGADLGYTSQEIASWVGLRDGAMHGDFKYARRLVAESDVRPLLPRMEQAAYDMLFNKAKWHDPSRERRSVYAFPCATTDAGSSALRLVQELAARFAFAMTDEWGVFPMNLQAVLSPTPEGWWCRTGTNAP